MRVVAARVQAEIRGRVRRALQSEPSGQRHFCEGVMANRASRIRVRDCPHPRHHAPRHDAPSALVPSAPLDQAYAS